MKTILALSVLFLTTSSFASELPLKVKKIIIAEIANDIFFEDEGAVRAPQNISDFSFKQVKSNLMQVTGASYSEWDMKVIGYDCTVKLLAMKIVSHKDIAVDCILIGENWPYAD
jgi:hypothetical protein